MESRGRRRSAQDVCGQAAAAASGSTPPRASAQARALPAGPSTTRWAGGTQAQKLRSKKASASQGLNTPDPPQPQFCAKCKKSECHQRCLLVYSTGLTLGNAGNHLRLHTETPPLHTRCSFFPVSSDTFHLRYYFMWLKKNQKHIARIWGLKHSLSSSCAVLPVQGHGRCPAANSHTQALSAFSGPGESATRGVSPPWKEGHPLQGTDHSSQSCFSLLLRYTCWPGGDTVEVTIPCPYLCVSQTNQSSPRQTTSP